MPRCGNFEKGEIVADKFKYQLIHRLGCNKPVILVREKLPTGSPLIATDLQHLDGSPVSMCGLFQCESCGKMLEFEDLQSDYISMVPVRRLTMGEKVNALLPMLGEPTFSNWERKLLRSYAGRAFGNAEQEKWVDAIYAKHIFTGGDA